MLGAQVHDDQRQANLEHTLSLAKTVSPGQLSEHLEHVLDYVPRFKQASALNARIAKFLGKKTREWLHKANDTDRQAWFEASAHYRGVCALPNPQFHCQRKWRALSPSIRRQSVFAALRP